MGALRGVLLEALALKALPRAGWVRAGVGSPESVAAHSWGVAWLVLALCPAHLNLGEALALAVIHDLPEVYAGDLTPHDQVTGEEKRRREAAGLARLLGSHPDRARAGALTALWRTYADGATAEARFVKACDKLDMALQAARYQAEAPGLSLSEFIASALGALSEPDLRALATP